jgi:MoaA/NifB/PqqE/SkfB family radical SAM enzyme
MFAFNRLKTVQIEITTRCQASCPMCARNIHGGPINPNLKLADWTLEEFKSIFSLEVCQQISTVVFCGSFGEPVINNDLLDMCQHLTDSNPNLAVRLHTNGSVRNTDWWCKLAKVLPKDHLITFGIDGMWDTHHVHRIGTDWNKIIDNARSFITAGGNAEWVFIKFAHNEHQVNDAQVMARDYGFKSFVVKNSIRFEGDGYPVIDNAGNTLYNIKPPQDNVVKFVNKDIVNNFNQWFDSVNIECHVLKNKEIYIDAYKNMYPCCWIASAPYLYNDPASIIYPYKQKAVEEFYKVLESLGGFDAIDLTKKSIKEIIEMPSWQSVWQSHWDDKILICAKNCGNTELTNTQDQVIAKIDV